MKTSRRLRIEALFEAALEVPAGERQSWLSAKRLDQPEIVAEVEALLAAHERADGVLDKSPPAAAFVASDALISERIGPYRIIGELGRGGMGVVFLGERADGQFTQRVAIKLIRADADAEQLHRRLEAERQILASLNHPNIARLLDGGLTGDGRPYLVMEHIEGRPIGEYCDRRRLSVEERLKLFCIAARAVHHAHRNLVVHRDLKPSNIFVTADGVVKLLDFGIAKILDPSRVGGHSPLTQTGHGVMTPEYASPEQFSGEPITTATDVYALGVVLYELLTGRRPFQSDGPSLIELARRVVQHEPLPPSQAVVRRPPGEPDVESRALEATSGQPGAHDAAGGWVPLAIDPRSLARSTEPRRLSRRLRGDLDRIVLMALRKEAERRYPSALQLAEDVERHLEGRPVFAQGDSAAYRARKFVARHRWSMTAAALAVLSLITGTAGVAWQARRAERQAAIAEEQRDRAQSEAVKAARVAGLMMDIFKLSDPTEALGDTITARQILDQGTERISREFGDQPEVQAEMLAEVARVYHNLGLFDRAERLARRSLSLREDLYGSQSPEVSASAAQLGDVLAAQGRRDEAIAFLTRSIEVRAAALPAPDSLLARTQADLAWQLRSAGQHAEAAELFATALETQRTILGDAHPDVAATLFGLASARHDAGQFDEAEATLERALSQSDTSLSRPHPMAATALINIGMLRRLREQYRAAEPLVMSAVSMRTRLYDSDHPDVIEAKSELGVLLRDLGRYQEAERQLQVALASANRTFGLDHEATGTIRERHATVLTDLGRYAEAIATMDTAIRVKRAREGGNRTHYLMALVRAGEPLRHVGRLREAEKLYREAYDTAGASSVYTIIVMEDLGRIDLAYGRYDAAIRRFDAALTLASERLRENHRYALSVRRAKAEALIGLGRPAEAISLLESVLPTEASVLGEPHPKIGYTLVELARAQLATGDAQSAATTLRRAEVNLENVPSTHWIHGEIVSLRGASLLAQGREADALPSLREGLRLIRDHVGPVAPQARRAERRLPTRSQ